MPFSNCVHRVPSIGGYDQAARHFAETKKPKTARWADDERPLYNTRSLHYKIVRGTNADYFDLVNYDTPLIRYYRPEADGAQRILVRGWASQVSRQFLYKHRWYGGKCLTVREADGTERQGKLLLNSAVSTAAKYGVPDNWSADLMLVAGREDNPTIDITRSRHIPGFKAVSSDGDKAKRKAVKQVTEHWVELMAYRLSEFESTELGGVHSHHRSNAGQLFRSATDFLNYNEIRTIKEALRSATLLEEDTSLTGSEDFANAMTRLAHACYVHMSGVRENQQETRFNWETNQMEYITELKPVTRDDLKKSLTSHLISLLGLRDATGRQEIEQFPASIPRKWWC